MTQRTWSTTEVSAYLDGQLDPQLQVALEADMAHNADLRQWVEKMQQMVSMLRATPLREAPRNYLLTPAMVTEIPAQRSRLRRHVPLWGLRLATAITTLAFVITFGLSVLQNNMMPSLQTGASEAPEAALLAQDTEVVKQAPDQTAREAPQSAPGMMMAPTEPAQKLQMEETEPVNAERTDDDTPPQAEEDGVPAPIPEAVLVESEVEAPAGVGGGSEALETETLVMALEAPAVEETLQPSATADEVLVIAPEEVIPVPQSEELLYEAETEEEVLTRDTAEGESAVSAPEAGSVEEPSPDAGSFGDISTEQPSDREMTQETTHRKVLSLASEVLGVAALVLVAITLWVTHRPLIRHK